MEYRSGPAARYFANFSPRPRGPEPSFRRPRSWPSRTRVRQFKAEFEIAGEDATVTALLLDLVNSRGAKGKQIHDANIVATMRRYGIPSLLTHNTADFTRYVPDINLLPLIR